MNSLPIRIPLGRDDLSMEGLDFPRGKMPAMEKPADFSSSIKQGLRLAISRLFISIFGVDSFKDLNKAKVFTDSVLSNRNYDFSLAYGRRSATPCDLQETIDDACQSQNMVTKSSVKKLQEIFNEISPIVAERSLSAMLNFLEKFLEGNDLKAVKSIMPIISRNIDFLKIERGSGIFTRFLKLKENFLLLNKDQKKEQLGYQNRVADNINDLREGFLTLQYA